MVLGEYVIVVVVSVFAPLTRSLQRVVLHLVNLPFPCPSLPYSPPSSLPSLFPPLSPFPSPMRNRVDVDVTS